MPTVSTSRELGLVLRQRRRALRLTQEQVADRVGASRRWVSSVEAGAPRSELGMVLRLVRALGLLCALDVATPERGPLAAVDLDAVLASLHDDG